MTPNRTQHSFAIFMAYSVAFLLLGLFYVLVPSHTTLAQNQPEALGQLSGTVRDGQGTPLPNITVWLEHSIGIYSPREVKSDSSGHYQFFSVPPGNYRLRFEDPAANYATKLYSNADFAEDATLVAVNGNEISGVNMELTLGGSISVTLQNAVGLTNTNYTVILYRKTLGGGWKNYRQVTPLPDSPGVRFESLPTGPYRLCVTAYNYDISYNSVTSAECYDNILPPSYTQLSPSASNIEVQAGQESAIAVTINDRPQIQGYILGPNNQPLVNIPVHITQPDFGSYPLLTARTDSNGYFYFGYIERGTYALTFNPPYYGSIDYLPRFYPDEVAAIRGSDIIVDENTQISVTQRLPRAGRITGKVTLPDNVPLDWANVVTYRQTSDGTWSFPETCNALCTQSLYDPATGVYTVTQVFPSKYKLRADFYLNGAPYYSVSFYGGNSFEDADEIVVGPGETVTDINFVVGETAFESSITGHVTANGAALQGIEVGLFTPYLYPVDNAILPIVSTTTDAQGDYILDGLALGTYQVAFRDPAGIYATTFYTKSPSGTPYVDIFETRTVSNVNISLSPGATIRGHIRTQGDRSPSGFTMFVVPQIFDSYNPYPYSPFLNVRTDANGFFEISGLAPGAYYVGTTTPTGSGEFPGQLTRYYPDAPDPYYATLFTLEAGQTLEGIDFFFFTTPTSFLPIIRDGEPPAESASTPTPLPIYTVTPPRPTPTVTPALP